MRDDIYALAVILHDMASAYPVHQRLLHQYLNILTPEDREEVERAIQERPDM